MTSRGPHAWDVGALPVISPETLSDIVSTLADFAVVINAAGRVLSILANPFHESMTELGSWENEDVREYLTVDSRPKFDAALARFLEDPGRTRSTELNHHDRETGAEFPVVYSLHGIGEPGAHGGDILMIGRDLRPIADLQQQLVDAQMAIERDYEAQRGFDTRYRVLMQASTEAMVFVSVATGRISDANGAASSLFGRTAEELKDTAFANLFEDQGRGELMAEMAAAALSEGPSSVPLLSRSGQRALRATPSFFRSSGTRTMLCRIEPEGTPDAAGDEIGASLAELYETGPDAIVFTNRDGIVTAANEAFLNLTEVAHGADLRGRPLSDFLERELVDLKVLLENARRKGRMRLYATRIAGPFDGTRQVEISATHLTHASAPAFAFVMRDAQIAGASRSLAAAGGEPGSSSVIELVGNTTLKDIVADTTDVIEKMCIETAIELTGNNRVAAAEMLGLSRQSLYVKLRKYGLLQRPSSD